MIQTQLLEGKDRTQSAAQTHGNQKAFRNQACFCHHISKSFLLLLQCCCIFWLYYGLLTYDPKYQIKGRSWHDFSLASESYWPRVSQLNFQKNLIGKQRSLTSVFTLGPVSYGYWINSFSVVNGQAQLSRSAKLLF